MKIRLAYLIVLSCITGLVACGDESEGAAHEVVHKGCSENADCPGGRCVEGLPGGLCTSNCSSQEDCPNGTTCTDTEAHGGVCLFTCTNTEQCLDLVGSEYVCDTESNLTTDEDTRVCIDE